MDYQLNPSLIFLLHPHCNNFIYLTVLQNRVDPQGNIITTSARGAWTGTRGQLHGTGKTILRPFKLKAWITCLLQFKNRHRQVMAPNLYTELFFLDEATAFAAGHRPCCECRRLDYDLFKRSWVEGNPAYGFNKKTLIREIDEVLHKERIDKKRRKVTSTSPIENLPDGTFIQIEGECYLLSGDLMHRWTPFGYDRQIVKTDRSVVTVLTPVSIVNTFRMGYKPHMAI